MSMPTFPDINGIPNLEEALSAIIISIAMEETALSHILNAEGEKIQYVIDYVTAQGYENIDMNALLAVNNSVADVIKSIADIQAILKEKLDIATQNIPPDPPAPDPPAPDPPAPDPPTPDPPAVCCFEISPGTLLRQSATLALTKTCRSSCGISAVLHNCESMLVLPPGKKITISFELTATNPIQSPAEIIMQFRCGTEIVHEEAVVQQAPGPNVKISYQILYEVPGDCTCNTAVFKLASPEYLSCVAGSVCIEIQSS